MKKISVFITVVVIVALVLFSYFLSAVIYTSNPTTSVGTIVKNPENKSWGLETRRKPLTPKTIFVLGNLPTEFQIVGAKVKATYEISDVIGAGEWGVVVRIVTDQIEFVR